MTGPAPAGCPRCTGPLVDGRIAVPIVGSLRFVYRLGTNDVATEVAARMCQDCGHVDLVAREPQVIARARRAAEQARVVPRRVPRGHRNGRRAE
jgi:protein involved in polysaccharide export with SLBB domain